MLLSVRWNFPAPIHPITVRRKVKPGQEAAYEDWLQRLTQGVKERFTGYLGTDFHKPQEAVQPYTSVFRFDSLANLEAFETSDFRADMLRQGAPLFAEDAVWAKTTGLEVWFEAPKGTKAAQPSPHRMALVLIIVVFCLVLLLNILLGPLIGHLPLAARVLITVIPQVLLMTYLIMPRLTRLLAPWIFPTTKTVN